MRPFEPSTSFLWRRRCPLCLSGTARKILLRSRWRPEELTPSAPHLLGAYPLPPPSPRPWSPAAARDALAELHDLGLGVLGFWMVAHLGPFLLHGAHESFTRKSLLRREQRSDAWVLTGCNGSCPSNNDSMVTSAAALG